MKKLMLAAAIFGLSFGFQNSFAQEKKEETKKTEMKTTTKTKSDGSKKKVVVNGKKGEGSKHLTPPGDDQPLKKHRGSCYMYMDNYTGYYVDIYVEDKYMGRLSPYATSVRFDVWVPGNWTHWYAQTAGGTYYWTNDSYCNDSRVFTLNLNTP